MELDARYREALEEALREDAKYEAGLGSLIYSWIVKIFAPFAKLGL